MRKIGIFFFALFAVTVVLAGCNEKEPKKTEDQEATPSVSLLPQDAPVFSSDELFFPNVDRVSVTTSSKTSKPSSTTAANSSATSTTASSSKNDGTETTVTEKAPSDKGGLELPDHNWK